MFSVWNVLEGLRYLLWKNPVEFEIKKSDLNYFFTYLVLPCLNELFVLKNSGQNTKTLNTLMWLV